MIDKLLNFIKTKRFVDIFCYVFCGIYLFFAISVACLNANYYKTQENNLNNLLSYVNSVNKKIELQNMLKKDETTDSDSTDVDYPVYTDGKALLVSAYDKFYNSNSFLTMVNGTLATNAVGIDMQVSFELTAARYTPTKNYSELLVRYLNASSMQDMIEENAQFGYQIYKIDDAMQARHTYTVARENNSLKGVNYSNPYPVQSAYPLADNLMIINEETITAITYFKIKEKGGKPSYYYVQASLNPQLAAVNFRNTTGFNIGSFTFNIPNYTSCQVTACIDASGTLIGLTCADVAQVAVSGPVVGSMTTTCYYNYNYAISGINQEISFVPEGF